MSAGADQLKILKDFEYFIEQSTGVKPSRIGDNVTALVVCITAEFNRALEELRKELKNNG